MSRSASKTAQYFERQKRKERAVSKMRDEAVRREHRKFRPQDYTKKALKRIALGESPAKFEYIHGREPTKKDREKALNYLIKSTHRGKMVRPF